jgi:hypothetical protein
VFSAPGLTLGFVLDAYFVPDHLAAQDALTDLADRTVVSDEDDGAVRRTTWRVTSTKSLPVFVRPFVPGGRLRYLESMTLRRADGAIDLTIKPEILKGRVHIDALYELAEIAPGQIRRRYKGSITAGIALLGGRVEKGILAEIQCGMPIMTKCTQDWLAANVGR